MAVTPSNMLELGTKAPHFSLLDAVSNKRLSLDELKGKNGTLICFICNHCPFVKHIQSEFSRLAGDYQSKCVSLIAISSNDVSKYPEDAPDKMREFAKENHFSFPYLFDETQEVAKSYKAACTPDFYLFDGEEKLVYRGQLDDARPKNGIPVTGESIRKALDALLLGKPVLSEQKPSIGCNIKWK